MKALAGALVIAVVCRICAAEEPSLMSRLKGEISAADGVLLLKQGKIKEALELLERARSDDGTNPYIDYALAGAAAASADAERAIAEIRSAIDKISPESLKSDAALKKLAAAGWYNLGVLLTRKGSLAEALSAFKNSLDIVPQDKDAVFNYNLVSKLLAERKKQEEENRKKQEELKKVLEELAKRIMALVEAQGKAMASLWRAHPELMPTGAVQEAAKQEEPKGQGLLNLGKRLLKGLVEGLKGKDIPPIALDENLKPEDVAAWVKALFAPQPAVPDDVLQVTEGNMGEEARAISGGLRTLADGLTAAPQGNATDHLPQNAQNPLAEALKQSAQHLDVGAAHASEAAKALGEQRPADAGTGMALAEREFLLALAPFLQPPQAPQQQRGDKQDEKQDNKEQTGQEQKQEKGEEEQKAEEKEAEQKEVQAEQLTPEEAKRLLDAMKQDDKEALMELLERRAKSGGRVNVEKDW